MKARLNKWIDWFEEHFNFIVDTLALFGGLFCLLLAIIVFFVGIFGDVDSIDNVEVIIIPGVLGFFGIIMLFALRITRRLTNK